MLNQTFGRGELWLILLWSCVWLEGAFKKGFSPTNPHMQNAGLKELFICS